MGNHAYQIVAGLHRHQMLRRAYVMRYGGGDPFAAQARTAYWTERVAYRLARYLRADQYVLRDNLFDFYVSRQVRNADIFYGWTHHALYSLRAARRRGLITILERANAHPLTVTRLLADEYKRRGVTEPVYHPRILQKHLRELEIADYIAVTSHFHSLFTVRRQNLRRYSTECSKNEHCRQQFICDGNAHCRSFSLPLHWF